MNKKYQDADKIEIELEKLKLIAEYYDIPLAAFFMSTDEWKELIAKEGSRREAIKKETIRKLELLKEMLEWC